MKGKVMSRKIMILMGLLSIALCLAGRPTAWAHIPDTGTPAFCAHCHVSGTPTEGPPASNWALLPIYAEETGCIQCHSSSTSSTTYVMDAGGTPLTVPVTVYTGANEPTEFLASGNFWWVKGAAHGTPGDPMTDWTGGGNDAGGHNIFPGEPDQRYVSPISSLSTAPGHSSGCLSPESCHSNLNTVDTTYGSRQSCLKCHMMVTGTEYPSGFHHADDTGGPGGVVGLSHTVPGDPGFDGFYCFLTGHMSGQGHGVAGIEDDDWEATVSSIDHNEYAGSQSSLNQPGGFMSEGNTTTGFCSGCHGNFHISSIDATGAADTWFRHPVGMVLPDSGDFHSYSNYNPNVPLGRPDLDNPRPGVTYPSSEIYPDYDSINCLTCHRSHGTPGGSHLRWDPTLDTACATCHITKRSSVEGYYICDSIDDCNDCHTAHGRSLRYTEDVGGGNVIPMDEYGTTGSNEKLVWSKVEVKHYGDDVAITVPANPYDTYVQVDASDISTFAVGDVVMLRDGLSGTYDPPHEHEDNQIVTITSVDTGNNRYYFDDPLHIPHSYPAGSKLYRVELKDCTYPIPGDSPYVRGAEPYDGVCEVCHTLTDFWKNDGTGADHFGGPGLPPEEQCQNCHLHVNEWYGDAPDDAGHNTHALDTAKGPDPLDCDGCHLGDPALKVFLDGQNLTNTNMCNACHSEGGAFDGAAMAKANYADGVYNLDGTLKAGMENWCLGCHDIDQACSDYDCTGALAPIIAGDNTNYGFYANGHGLDAGSNYQLMYYQEGSGTGNPGAGRICTDCHDSEADHFDPGELTRLKSGFENDQDNTNCNQCHPPGTTAISPPELYTNSAEYEAAAHGGKLCTECHDTHGAVADHYPAMALDDGRALCLSCHNDTPPNPPSAPPEAPAAHDEASEIACSTCHNPHLPAHGGGEPNCFTAGCHTVNLMHAAHFVPDPGPNFPPNETGCYYCHADGRDQCADAPLFKNVVPEGPPQYLSETAVCDPCHSEVIP